VISDFRLSEDDRKEFRGTFLTGRKWSRLRDDGELMRFWHVLREEPGRVLVQHGTGAVAFISIEDDRISRVRIAEGPEAESILRGKGFRISRETRRRAGKFLRHGRRAADAMQEAWPGGLGYEELSVERAGDGKLYRYRFSWGGLLELKTDANDRIRDYSLIEGGAALDTIREELSGMS
jgi:hypothetical protein